MQRLTEEDSRLGKLEDAHGQTADKLVDAIVAAGETNEKLAAAEANLKSLKMDLREKTEDLEIRLTLEAEKTAK